MTTNKLRDRQAPVYKCSGCGRERGRDKLTVKRSIFQGFGRNGKLLRSRVVAWLCDDCRSKDPDWEKPQSKGGVPAAPGEEVKS